MDVKDKTLIGKIIKPQGIRGEVKVLPLNAVEHFEKLKAVYLNGAGEPVPVKSCSVRGGYVYILLAGITARNDAELLRNKELYIEKAEIKLKKGAYFIKDVIGCKLLDSSGAALGVVTQIDNFGSADVYTAENDGRVFRFPYIKSLKPKVDIDNKTIIIDRKIFDEICVE